MDNKYVCQVCKKNFSCRQNLRRHRLNIHKGAKRSSSDRINDEVVPLRLLDLGNRSGKKGAEPPCFLQKFAYASVPEGTPHKFECAVTGHPRPSVTWFKDGDCIFDSVAEYTVTCYNGSCSLRLGDPDMYQEGRYTCRAENILGRVDCSAELECLCMHDALGETVSSKPHKCCHCGKGFSVETDLDLHKDKFHFGPHWDEFHFESGGLIPPRFIKKPVSAAVHEGEPHEFECQVNGMPLPTVSWYKDGICVNESLPDYAITYHSGTSTLQIRSDAKYEGIYTSRAENILTRVDCSVELKCLYRHDSSDESTKLYECRYCDQVFSDESDMPLHVDRFHFREACDDAFNLPIEPEVKVHACMHCGKGVTYVKNLQKHLKSMHGTIFASSSAQQGASSETVTKVTSSETVAKVTSSETVMKLKPHKCCYCEKSFTVRANLQRHVKTYHSEIPMQGQFSYVLGLFSCHEEDCFQPTFRYASELREHLTLQHNFEFLAEHLDFFSKNAFLKWKEILEADNMVFYTSNGGLKKKKSMAIRYYGCSRSGKYKSESKGMRTPKESTKLGYNCTSTMKTEENLNTGHVAVILYGKHYGHTFSFHHIRLPEKERTYLAKKIECKGNLKEVLNEIRGPVGEKPLKRLHFATMKDLQNIKRAYNLKDHKLNDSNAPVQCSSAKLMTEKIKELTKDCPPLCSKFQGETLREFDNDEVFFVIQYPLQKQILNKYGNKTIYAYSTHGTNSSNFIVITLLVINQFHEGFPVAWCISNRQDRVVLRNFFEVIEENDNIGLKPKYFMSNLEPSFYHAWSDVFGAGAQKLIATSYLQKALRNQLQILIPNKSLINQVKNALDDLIEEPEIEKFESMLRTFLEDLDSSQDTEDFAEYFSNSYVGHAQEWAHCYRIGSGLIKGNYMESFHKDFKDFYEDEKVSQQLDKLIHFIVHIAYNRAVDWMTRQEKELANKAVLRINKCHQSSLKVGLNSVTPIHEAIGQYIVNSESENQQYQVEIMKQCCELNCAIKCLSCNVCIHQVKCTCIDFLNHSNICDHVHLVCRFISTQTKVTPKINKQSNLIPFDTEEFWRQFQKE